MRKKAWGGIWIRLLFPKLVISLNRSASVSCFIPQWGGGGCGRGTQMIFPECLFCARWGAGHFTCDVTGREWQGGRCDEWTRRLAPWFNHLLLWLWAGYLLFLAINTHWAFTLLGSVSSVLFICLFSLQHPYHKVLLLSFWRHWGKKKLNERDVKSKSVWFYSPRSGGHSLARPLISWVSLGKLFNLSWDLYSMLWTAFGT